MKNNFNTRSLFIALLLIFTISSFAQLPTNTTRSLKRATPAGTPAGKVAYTRGINLVIYDPSTNSEQLIAANTPSPLFTWGGGKIAYSTTTTDFTIYTVPIDGSSAPSTLYGATGFIPTISMDGKKIAYKSYPSLALGIVNLVNNTMYEVPTIIPSAAKMHWFPGSNTEITYITDSGKIAKYNFETLVKTEYTLHSNIIEGNDPNDFFWKPDGTAFIYADDNKQSYIYNINSATNTMLNGETETTTTPHVKWQPNGNNASYLLTTGLNLYNPTTSTYATENASFIDATSYDWTQDSNSMIFTDRYTMLKIYNTSSNTSTIAEKYDPTYGGMTSVMGVVMPQWIPGSTSSAAVTSVTPNTVFDNQGTVTVTVAGRGLPTNPNVKLTFSTNSYAAYSIISSSDTQIIFTINANSMLPGLYSVDILDSTNAFVTSMAAGITVTHVNQAPVITPSVIPDIVVNEDSGPYSFTVTVKPGGSLDVGQVVQVFPSTDNSALIGAINTQQLNTDGLTQVNITPAANANGIANFTVKFKDNGGTANSGIDTTTTTFKYTVNPVNDAPKFDTITDITELNCNQKNIIIPNTTAGPTNESAQTLTFIATSSNPTFLPDPAILKNIDTGNWEVICKPNLVSTRNTAKITILLQDNGGTEIGGSNSFNSSFNFTVDPINIAPKFDVIPNQTIKEDSIFNLTVMGLSAGNAAEDVTQTINITANSSDPYVLPAITVTKITGGFKLSGTPEPNATGLIQITVKAADNGGTANGGIDTFTQTFDLDISQVNDAPIIDNFTDVSTTDTNNYEIIINNINPGGGNDESDQLITVTAKSSNPLIVPDPVVGSNVSGNTVITISPTSVYQNTTVTITVTALDDGGSSNGGIDKTVRTFLFTINHINVAPAFDNIINQTILEDNSLNLPITGRTAGSAGEDAVQALSFSATSSNTALIPDPQILMIANIPTLVATPVANLSGVVTITLTVKDNGGVANGGVDTYSDTFDITVTPVNDIPGFTALPEEISTSLDSPIETIITGVTPGGNGTESSQTITFSATVSDSQLIPTPTFSFVSGVWKMTISPYSNIIGFTNIDVKISDNGGTANGGIDNFIQRIKFTHSHLNTPPKFDVIQNQTMNEDTVLTVPVTSIISGAYISEINQTISFSVTISDSNLFNAAELSFGITSGTMKFTPKADKYGTVTVNVKATDNGGTDNGGVDTYQQDFTITVNPVNDAPSAVMPTVAPVSGDGREHNLVISEVLTGPLNEQTQTFDVTASTDTSSLISNLRVDGSGDSRTIYYTSVDGKVGTGNIIITVTDNGGTLYSGTDRKVYNVPVSILSKPGTPTFITPVDGNYTSGDDRILVTGIAESSKVKFTAYRMIYGYEQTRISSWDKIGDSGFVDSDNETPIDIASNMTLTSGKWYLKIIAEDDRGGTAESLQIVVTVPTILPPAIVDNSLILFGMPIDSNKSVSSLPNNIKLATFNPTLDSYTTYITPTATTFNSSLGYWIRSNATTGKIKFTGNKESYNKTISLNTGWNLIPNPFIDNFTWSLDNITIYDSISETNMSLRNATDVILPYAWIFTSNQAETQRGHYSLVYDSTVIPGINNTIPVWNGFWVKALKPCSINFQNPDQSNQYMTRSSKRKNGNGWSTRIIASNDKGASEVVIGTCESPVNISLSTPPESPLGNGAKISAFRNGSQLSADFISNDQNKEWTLIISKENKSDGNVTLNWPDLSSSISSTETILLTDTTTGKKVALNQVRNYTITFAPNETARTLKLSLTKRTASALQIKNMRSELNRNGGNVSFELSSPAVVTMTVRNIVGKFISQSTLDAQSGGAQSMSWNMNGKTAGKYLIELKAADKDGRSIRAASMIFIK